VLIEMRTHKKWIIITLLALAVAGGYYYHYSGEMFKNGGTGPSGSTTTGLIYGGVGFLLMLFCGLLGVRRYVRVWKIGRARDWLIAHIWLGLLAFPLIFFHSGLLWGHHLTFVLMILFTIVLVTGILGVVLQQFIPSIMLEMVKNESTFEQIPFVIQKLKFEAAVLTSCFCGSVPGKFSPAVLTDIDKEKSKRLKDKDFKRKYGEVKAELSPEQVKGAQPLANFFQEEVEPFLDPKYLKTSKLAELQKAKAVFAHVQTLLPAHLHEPLEEIRGLCEERRQLEVQSRLHVYLHAWEYVHIPLSYLLLALSFFHVIIATISYSGVTQK
jgi:hypothetical protein